MNAVGTAITRIAGSLLGCLLLAGCAGPTVVSSDGATAVVGASTEEGMDALLTGVAAIDDGCWVIRSDDGSVHHIFWPKGTTLEQSGIQPPRSAEPIADGDAVRASGGEIAGDSIPLDHGCWDEDGVVFAAWRVERDE